MKTRKQMIKTISTDLDYLWDKLPIKRKMFYYNRLDKLSRSIDSDVRKYS